MRSLLSQQQIDLTIQRLAHQLTENNIGDHDTVVIGIQPRGVYLSDRLVSALKKGSDKMNILYGKLDITFYRDDIRKELHVPNQTDIKFSIEGKKLVIVDDVLYTGRTIRAALDALLSFGRP